MDGPSESTASCTSPSSPSTQTPRYKSEVFMPIRQDSQSFEDRQKVIWDDMHQRMERRKKEWDDEVVTLKKDFFRHKPGEARRESSDNIQEKKPERNGGSGGNNEEQKCSDGSSGKVEAENCRGCTGVGGGSKVFRVSFDVSQFLPEEISVRTQDQRLIVNAKHEQKGGTPFSLNSKGCDKNVTREFSRQVDIPTNIDPLTLHSTLSKDGILQVEAVSSAPAYDGLRETAHRLHGGGNISLPTTYSGSSAPASMSSSTTSQRSSFLGGGTSTMFDCGPAVTEEDGTKVFRISVDIGTDFHPTDLTVKTVDRKLVVHARHEEKTPGRTSSKEFNREFDLPDSVDPNLVTASMTSEGHLVLEAPISSYTQGSYTGRPGSTKQPSVNISFVQKGQP